MKRSLRSLTPILVAGALFAIALLTLHTLSDAQKADHLDPILLGVISFSYLIAAGTMMWKTRLGPWTILGAGLLLTMLADAILYFLVFSIANGWTTWYDVVYEEVQPGIILAGTSSPLVDIGRSLLVVGGPLLVLGAILEWRTPQE